MQASDKMSPWAGEWAAAPVSSNIGGKAAGKPGVQKYTLESMNFQKLILTNSGSTNWYSRQSSSTFSPPQQRLKMVTYSSTGNRSCTWAKTISQQIVGQPNFPTLTSLPENWKTVSHGIEAPRYQHTHWTRHQKTQRLCRRSQQRRTFSNPQYTPEKRFHH